MTYLLIAHLVAAIVAPILVPRIGRRAFIAAALIPGGAFVYIFTRFEVARGNEVLTEHIEWIPALGLGFDLRLDSLSWLLSILVCGIGAIVLTYCMRYFARSAKGLSRFCGIFVAFAGSMLGLVLADNLILLYVFWELTTVFSYLLIGHYTNRKTSRRSAMEAIIVTSFGGLSMLAGFILLGTASGTYTISEIVANPPTGAIVVPAILLILVGALSKSALLPFHFWLPAAMAAPTPVSAYLHAAAMVKAGVYLVARLAPGFAHLPAWRIVIITLACATILLGGWQALKKQDLKLVLAYGTVSQLGLIILLVGSGSRSAALAGLAMLGSHALFKSALFLLVGLIDVTTGTRDLRLLSGLGRKMPALAVAGGLAVGSMIGLPPLAGFVAKEAALQAFLSGGGNATGFGAGIDAAVLGVIVLGSILTCAYGLRFWWGAFGTKEDADPTEVKRPPVLLAVPPILLALLGLVIALVPGLGDSVLASHAMTYPEGTELPHLVLWHGFGPGLVLTLVVFAGGFLLFWLRRKLFDLSEREAFPRDEPVVAVPGEPVVTANSRAAIRSAQARGGPHAESVDTGFQSPPTLVSSVKRPTMPRSADQAYRLLMRFLDRVAAEVTATTQRGSLPFYLGTILVTFSILGGGAAIVALTRGAPVSVKLWDTPGQAAVAAIVCAAAILAARARRRLKAVLLLGITGYGAAMLFLFAGAPDLALTQILVETISLVVFVLVMRRLPPYFTDRPFTASRWFRLFLGVVVGATVVLMALAVPGARIAEPVSKLFPDEAVEFGGGNNIVNVTLVDIRAWDTVGEISVLLVAATGVASLIFIRRREGRIVRPREVDTDAINVWNDMPDQMAPLRRNEPEQPAGDRAKPWLAAGQTLAPARRSLIFEVVTRLLFHTMLIFSLYLMFSGHNAPGGGFAAGLVVGLALTIRYLAGGRYELDEAAPIHAGVLLGMGLFLSAGVGLGGIAFGAEALQSTIIEFTLPIFGDIHLVTSLFFDTGVYLVVIGLVLDILRSLGSEIDRMEDDDEDEFDPDPELGNTIRRRRRPTFRLGDRS